MNPSRSPDFQRPPITELGIGLMFPRADGLTSAHFGRFWAGLAKEFPFSEDHAPVGASEEWSVSKEGLPLPRIWLLEQGSATLIQLQANRFYVNWRRQAEPDSYPGFKAHLTRFLEYWKQFGAFMRDEIGQVVPIQNAEVLKVSQIHQGDFWNSIEHAPKLFPVLNLGGLAGEWRVRGFSFVLALNQGESPLQIDVKSARPIADKSKQLLQLEIRVPISGIDATSTDVGNLSRRLVEGNEIANLAFTSITSKEAQQNVWQRRG